MDAAQLERVRTRAIKPVSTIDAALLIPAGGFIGLAILGLFLWWLFSDNRQGVNTNLYLLPWIALTAIVICAPSAYSIYRKEFNFFQPLTLAAWGYFIPAFVVGGLIYSLGVTPHYYLYFIKNPEVDMPLTFVYISLGYAGLAAGFYLPPGRWIGEWLRKRTPVWDWQPNDLLMPGLILLIIGSISTLTAFASGVLGYQKNDEIGIFDGLIYLFSLFLIQASFILWFVIFRTKQLFFVHYAIMGIIILLILARAALAGNRGSLVTSFLLVFAAFALSGRKITMKSGITGSIILICALLVGMIWGSTFRQIKETQTKATFDEYVEYIPRTVDAIGRQDTLSVLEKGFLSLAERLENVSSVAVVVSNYEDLQPYEASYGLDNNIWKDLVTSVVPRFVWRDKPLASDPSKYGDLYFNFSENSFTITPMGDLLRNFGPIGVPLGMMVLGLLLRFLYATLIEAQKVTAWRASIYIIVILTAVSYEGFFGVIIPWMIRTGAIAILGILLLQFLIPKRGSLTA